MVLNQIIPFNKRRFDACMAFLSAKHKRPLTKYQLVKLHVLIDFFHILRSGMPVIGGPIEAWKDGPVVAPAYNRVEHFWKRLDETGQQPNEYTIDATAKYPAFSPTLDVGPDEFSENELSAMDEAWNYLIPTLEQWRGFKKAEKLFHETGFLGKAWAKAKAAGRTEIDWRDAIDAYDSMHATDHSYAKDLITFAA